MPIYEYKCQSCNKIFEELMGFNDKPLLECKSCGGVLQRVFSPAGIIFKGSGFYVTDHSAQKSSKPISDSSKTSALAPSCASKPKQTAQPA